MSNEPIAASHEKQQRRLSEEEEASLLGRYLYVFVGKLFARGWKRFQSNEILYSDDLLLLPSDEDPKRAQLKFLAEWEAEKARAATATTASVAAGKPPVEPGLFAALRRAEAKDVGVGAVFRFLADAATVAQPFILQGFISWLEDYVVSNVQNERLAAAVAANATAQPIVGFENGASCMDVPLWEGFVWAVGLGCSVWCFSLFNNASVFHTMKAFSNMRSAVTMSLYDKALRLEGTHKASGDAMQLHNTDAFKFIEMGFFFQHLWAAPLIIVAALVALYFFIGWAGVMSLAVILIFIPLQGFAASRMMTARAECTRWASRRLDAVNEMLQGIRIVKFMGWEENFERRVAVERASEVSHFATMYGFRSVVVILVSTVPMIVSFTVIAIAYALGEEITAKKVFPAVAMLNVLRLPMTFLPLAASKLIDLGVSLRRVRAFLDQREMEPYLQQFDDAPEAAVKMVDADLQCTVGEGAATERLTLMEKVNVTIPKGKLTIVCGATGAGKSTLLHAIVGEGLVSPTSYVGVSQSTAYVAQEAWIMNATVRENILVGRAFDKQRYLDVINNCCLVMDLHQLAASDMTEIGERGINLSGGQKQRIAFARAAYSEKEMVLMDDPLAAVDPHVCAALFDDCISGLLRDRTRVLVTHQVQFLPRADYVVLVQNRGVAFAGTYDELLISGIDASAFVDHHSPGSNAATPQAAGRGGAPLLDEPSPVTGADAVSASPLAGPSNKSFRQHVTEIPQPADDGKQGLISEELQVQGVVKGDTFGWFYSIQGALPVAATAVTFITWRAVMVVADLMLSWWSTRTEVLGKALTEDEYLYWYAIFVGLTMFTISLRQVPFVVGIMNAARQSHGELVHSVLRAPTSFFDTTPMGRILSRFSKDMEALDLVIPESLNFFYNLVLVISGAFAVMIYGAPYMAVVIVVMFVVFTLVFRYYVATNRAQKRLEANNRSPMSNIMAETLGGLPTIRAYGMEAAYVARHAEKVELAQRSTYGWRNSQRWLSMRVDSLSAFLTLSTTVLIAALVQSYDPSAQLSALPIMALAASYSLAMGGAIGFITQMSAELESAFSSVERIKEYSKNIAQEAEVEYGTGPGQAAPLPESWPESGSVQFRDVSCRYRDGLPLVLRDVSFNIESGEKIGIVGRTGSGKSTIMLTLFRMIELAGGSITISGRDIATLKMRDLRSKVTIIPQDPLLFSGTIRSNLDPFEEATDDHIWTVLRRVDMEERVLRDGMGLDCVVAERGSNFSVGQRQLLCLARALLKRCKVLLLDEATASVSFESDAMIQKVIRTEFSECTVLTIAHRLATVIDADKILVLDHGAVQEFGTPANLLADAESQFHGMVAQLGPQQFAALQEEAQRAQAVRQ